MFKVLEIEKKMSYSQIGQSKNVQFAAAVKTGPGTVKPLHSFFLCRDYFSDVLYGEYYKKEAKMYGFTFDGKTSVWEKKPHILVKYIDPSVFFSNIKLLHDFETMMGLVKSKVYTTNTKDMVLFIGSSQWKRATWMLSFYTWLIRCMAYNVTSFTALKEKAQGNDASYFHYLSKISLPKLLINWRKIVKGLSPTAGINHNIDFIHNNCGIVGLSQQITDKYGIKTEWVNRYVSL